MRDYKHQLSANLAASTRRRSALPARGKARALPPPASGGSAPWDQYSFKFYAVIGLIVLGVYLYIRYQINNRPDSVFAELYRTTKGHVASEADQNEIDKSKPVVVPEQNLQTLHQTKTQSANTKLSNASASLLNAKTANEKIDKVPTISALENGVGTEVHLFLANLDKKSGSVHFLPQTICVDLSEKNPYEVAIKKLLHSKSEKTYLINTFPDDAKLNKAWIENGVLLLDFNSRFEYNRFGHQGLKIQLQQVLWTAFDLSDQALERGDDKVVRIESVSILIDGKRKKSLGGEGLSIKPFYGREDLKRSLAGSSHG
jgi:spore germination protein GerM